MVEVAERGSGGLFEVLLNGAGKTLNFDDEPYPELAEECRALIWDLTAQVVRTGTSAVLDWNLWSRERRADAVRRATELGVQCHLHHVVLPLQVAVQRASDRRDPRAHRLDADVVRHLADLFEQPDESEGFVLHVVGDGIDQTDGSDYGGNVSGRV